MKTEYENSAGDVVDEGSLRLQEKMLNEQSRDALEQTLKMILQSF